MDEGRNGFLEIGRITGPHGVRGKVRVATYSGDPVGVLGVTRVALSGGRDRAASAPREFDVLASQRAGRCAVLALRGIDSPEAAAGLAGARVSVRREELPALPEDEFYWSDAVGCAVVDKEGSVLGEVTAVLPGPAHDWLVIRRDGGDGYLPVVAAFVHTVDIAARRIVATPPEGW
jgi:16S rRNA processing protein RimM